MTALTTKTILSDSFLIPGNENGKPIALAKLGDRLEQLASRFPPGTSDIDLSTLSVSVENGELIMVSVSTHERPAR
jgi:hypothetical protein